MQMGDLQDLHQLELDMFLPGSDGVSLSQTFQDWQTGSISLSPILNAWQSDTEEVRQTGISVESSTFRGDYNFDVKIEESSSKHYIFSEKLNRLYVNMDKAVPIKFNWSGPTMLHVRAMVMFNEPDHVHNPVFRCRTHNDENCGNNRDCKHFKHVLRCDSENSVYKENKVSRRQSVVTVFNNKSGLDGVHGLYRFMCFTTCNGVDAIGRRRTDLVLTLEDSNNNVHGRVVIGVKICSCPLRDKKRDEDDDGKKKRKSNDRESESKFLKKEMNCTGANSCGTVTVKREVGEQDYVDLQVVIPSFPTSKMDEFHIMLRRIVASFYAADADISAVTRNVQINKL